MEVAYCFVEVFNKSSQKWELLFDGRRRHNYYPCFVSGYNEITKQWSYYCDYPELPEKMDTFFNSDINSHALLHCFKKVENPFGNNEKIRGLPKNASPELKSKYSFLFEEVKVSCEVSHIILHELIHFNYDQKFNIYTLPKFLFKELEAFCYEDMNAGAGKERFISYRDYLGKTYFEELEYLQSFGDSCSVRIIYFVADRTELWESVETVASYFKGEISIVKRDHNISDKSYWDIECVNYNLLSYFIKKVSRNEAENDRIEYLAAKARDVVLENLKSLLTGIVADNSRNHLISRFEIAEKLFILGCNKGKADISYFRNLWEMKYGWVFKSAKNEMFLLRTIYFKQVNALVNFVNGIEQNHEDDTLIKQLKNDLEN